MKMKKKEEKKKGREEQECMVVRDEQGTKDQFSFYRGNFK